MREMGKRTLSILMTAVILLGIFPALSAKAAAETTTIDLSTVTTGGKGYSYAADPKGCAVVTITASGDYTLTQSGGGTVTANVIVEPTDTEKNVRLTLKGVNVQAGGYTQKSVYDSSKQMGTAAISIQGNTTCTMTLADNTENTLKGNGKKENNGSLLNVAAISVENTYAGNAARLATLIINGGGSLVAIGGWQCAGIGGSINRATGNVTVESGNITARGGDWSAGIGDGDSLNSSGDYLKWCCDPADAAARKVAQTSNRAEINIHGGYLKTFAGQSTPGIGTSDKLSASGGGKENGFDGRIWTGLQITIDGGTVIAEGGMNNLTAIGAGKDTVISPSDLIINKGAKVLAVSQACGYSIHNDGVNTASAAPQISAKSTANVFSYKFSGATLPNTVDFYRLSGTQYEKITDFPNNELTALGVLPTIQGLAVVLPDGSYQMKAGDTLLADIKLQGGGMVYGDGRKGVLYTANLTPKLDGAAWSGSGKAYTLKKDGGTEYCGTVVPAGTYEVYELSTDAAGAAVYTDTGVKINVTETAREADIDYSTLTLNAGAGIASVSGGGIYRKGEKASISATVSAGFVWKGWVDADGKMVSTAQSTTETVSGKMDLTAAADPAQTVSGMTGADSVYDGKPHAGYTGTPVVTGGSSKTTELSYYRNTGSESAPVWTAISGAPAQAGSYRLTAKVPGQSGDYAGNQTVTFEIAPKPVTITGVTAENKIYDGTASAAAAGTPVVSGKVEADDVTVFSGTASFADKNAGTGKSVAFSGYTLAGTSAGNYKLTAQPADVKADIAPREITVSGISAKNKTYDGGTAAELDFSGMKLDGKLPGDTLTATASGAFETPDAGQKKSVSISGLRLDGANGNYKLAKSGQQLSAAADIAKQTRTIPAPTVKANTTTSVTLNKAVPAAGAADGTVEYGWAAENNSAKVENWQTSPAFTKLINGTDYSFFVRIVGGKNYADAISAGTQLTTLKKTAVVVSGVTVSGKIYDGAAVTAVGTPAVTDGAGKPVKGIAFTYRWESADGTQLSGAPKNAGSYKLTVVAESDEYAGQQEINFAVAKAPVTVTAVNKNVTVGGALPAWSYTVTGLVSGEKLATPPALACAAADSASAGTWEITADGASAGDNYAVSYLPGTLTVTAKAPKNYQVIFRANGGKLAGAAEQSCEENARVTKPADPVKSGSVFLGWYRDAACVTAWNFASGTVTGNVELYAKWGGSTHSISGRVFGDGVTPLSGEVVTVEQGTNIFLRTATDSSGAYTFAGVAPGVYNVVAEKDGVTKTILVTLKTADLTEQNIRMPAGNVNSVLNVAGSMTPGVVVGGLEAQADALKKESPSATDVRVKMTVEEKPESVLPRTDVSEIKQKAEEKASGANLEFLDIAIQKTVTVTAANQEKSTTAPINTTDNILEIVIPYNTDGKENIGVYRYHKTAEDAEGATMFQALTAIPAADARKDKTFYVDAADHLIYVYAKKFSTYAISYTTPTGKTAPAFTPSAAPSTPDPVSRDAAAPAVNGTVTLSQTAAPAGTTVTVNLTPETGYRVNTVTVTDENGNSVEVKRGVDGHFTFTQPAGAVTVKATFRLIPADPAVTGVAEQLETERHLVYLHGYRDGAFRPSQGMTRAEMAQMFYNLLRNQDAAAAVSTASFTDVQSGAWCETAVRAMAALGVMKGVGDQRFAPNRAVTRAEFTVTAMRFAKLGNAATGGFTDVKIGDWFYAEVLGSVQYGWITGYQDGTFRPNAIVTRAEITAIVNRMLSRSADMNYVDANAASMQAFSDVKTGFWAYYDIAEAANAHGHTAKSGAETWTR